VSSFSGVATLCDTMGNGIFMLNGFQIFRTQGTILTEFVMFAMPRLGRAATRAKLFNTQTIF